MSKSRAPEWLAQLVKHLTLDLGVMGSNLVLGSWLGVEPPLKKKSALRNLLLKSLLHYMVTHLDVN